MRLKDKSIIVTGSGGVIDDDMSALSSQPLLSFESIFR